MIFKNEFAPYFEVSKHTRETQLELYINSATTIDFFSVVGKKKYDEIMQMYSRKYNVISVSGNIVQVVDTSVFSNENYLYCVERKTRHKFSVFSPTELQFDNASGIVAGNTLTYFIEFNLFEKIRAYLCHATWLRYCQAANIQNTASGNVQKILENSEFVSDYSIATYLNLLKRDCVFYEKQLVEFLDLKKCSRVSKKIAYPIRKKAKI